MKQNSELFKQASKYYNVPKPERKPNRALEWRVRKWHVRQDPDQLIRMFFEFLCRSYFKRAWTFPEMWLACSVEIICGDDCVPAPVLSGLSLLVARGLDQYKGFDDDTTDRIVDNPLSIHNLPKAIKMGLAVLSQQKVVRQTPLNRLFPLWQAAYGLQQEGHEHLRELDFDGAQGRLQHGHLLAMTMDNTLLLAIVDWSTGGVEPIQPDYDGDVYGLLKAVIPLLWLIQGSVPLDAETTFDRCRSRVDALQLDTRTSPKLARGIDLRRCTGVPQTNSETMMGSMPKYSVVGFRGFQIISDEGFLLPTRNILRSKLDSDNRRKRIKPLTEKAPEQFRVVFDNYDRMCALLPHNTGPGDWIIGDIEASVTFVLKEQTKSRYHVIGESVVDFLISLGNSVCYAPGSSYAVKHDKQPDTNEVGQESMNLSTRLVKPKDLTQGYHDEQVARNIPVPV
ncbi:hypothetical protein F5Y09DRAFT_345910 [Xylaria sp. FL1042]|nr:hypothetical protein F5Y09DRAFT_345910 [Xylaria sp. FL1042]